MRVILLKTYSGLVPNDPETEDWFRKMGRIFLQRVCRHEACQYGSDTGIGEDKEVSTNGNH